MLENSSKRCIGPTPAMTTTSKPSADFTPRQPYRETRLPRLGDGISAGISCSIGPGVWKASCRSADCARTSSPASRSATASSPGPTEWSEAETPGAGDLDGTLSVSGAFFCSAAIEEILAAVAASIQKQKQ
jgi:hypothetical protein